MRKRKISLGIAIDCQHKELFKISGVSRYEAIKALPIAAPTLMCSYYKHCYACPLFLKGKITRSLCTEFAPEGDVLRALELGAEFLTLEDVQKNEKDN